MVRVLVLRFWGSDFLFRVLGLRFVVKNFNLGICG